MRTYPNCLPSAGEDVRSSMAMSIGKFKLNFFILLRTLQTIQLNLSTAFRLTSWNSLSLSVSWTCRVAMLTQKSQPLRRPLQTSKLLIHKVIALRSRSYCNTYCTPPIFRQVLACKIYPSASPSDPHRRHYNIRTVWIGYARLCCQLFNLLM